MAVRASREVVFDAPVDTILDVLADIDAVPAWSSLHKTAEVLDRHPDGRPHHVRATLKIMGVTDKEILEYHWGDRWMVWDSSETFQQRGLHGEYNLTPEGEDRTRVRFDIILELGRRCRPSSSSVPRSRCSTSRLRVFGSGSIRSRTESQWGLAVEAMPASVVVFTSPIRDTDGANEGVSS